MSRHTGVCLVCLRPAKDGTICPPCAHNRLAEVMDTMDNCNHKYVIVEHDKGDGWVGFSAPCVLCGHVRS
jgi:hypothetical protein